MILSDDESDDACVNRRRSPDNDTCRPKPAPTQPSPRSSLPLSYGSSIPSPAPSLSSLSPLYSDSDSSEIGYAQNIDILS